MLACGWLRETVYFLPSRQRILPVFFIVIPFVSFYKTADSVTKQIRYCRTKRKRPPLVASQYWLATSGGRVPVVAVCVLHTQLRICCATDSAIL